MRVNAVVMIGLALLFGTAAVFVSRSWLDMQASQRLNELESAMKPAQTATIVVASAPLRFGMALNDEVLREIPWPAGSLPHGSFATIEELLAGEERSVLTPIEINEPVLSTKVTGPGQRGTLSAVIEDGMRAVTIRVNDVAGVAGFVLPEDRVDIVLTRQMDRDESVAEVILQGVRVLAIDQRADQRADEPAVVKAVTVEVDTKEAQKLALASAVGNLSLVLRSAGEDAVEFTHRVTLADLSPASKVASLSEQFPDNEPRVQLAAERRVEQVASPLAKVGITRATERTEYAVPMDPRR